jgi:sugar/nucleoside kinase (ribokinase family)
VSSANDQGRAASRQGDLPDVDLLVVDGWHAGLALPAARAAREHGIPVLLGAGNWRPLVADLLPLADFVIVSAHFPSEWIPPQTVSAHTSGGGAIGWRTATSSGEVAVPEVTAHDTLAAGDVFLGAAAYALAGLERDWPEVLAYAADVAARFVTQIGRGGLPRRAR